MPDEVNFFFFFFFLPDEVNFDIVGNRAQRVNIKGDKSTHTNRQISLSLTLTHTPTHTHTHTHTHISLSLSLILTRTSYHQMSLPKKFINDALSRDL